MASEQATIPSAFSAIASMLPDGLAWAYKQTVRDGRLYHQWELTGPRGGIHVSAWWYNSEFRNDNWMGGIEGHSPIAHDYREGSKPDHEHCWLLGGPCWHDGSSLQFSEQIASMLPYEDGPMGDYEHRSVLSVMLNRYGCWLPDAQAIETQRAKTAGLGPQDESAVRQDAPDNILARTTGGNHV